MLQDREGHGAFQRAYHHVRARFLAKSQVGVHEVFLVVALHLMNAHYHVTNLPPSGIVFAQTQPAQTVDVLSKHMQPLLPLLAPENVVLIRIVWKHNRDDLHLVALGPGRLGKGFRVRRADPRGNRRA